MAALCKHVSAEFCLFSRSVLTGIWNYSLRSQTVRCLYSRESLGLDGYERSRERTGIQFRSIEEKFRSKMEESSDESSTSMIFTEDLKNMTFLANNDPSDVDLVMKMIKKYNKQNKNLRFGSFVFGPVVMRMFHYLNQPEAALSAFTDPEIDGFFDQLSSFQILLDLLYNNQMYNQVIDVFQIVTEKQLNSIKYPRHCISIVFASLYKLNTPESLKKATELWSEMQNAGVNPLRRTSTLAAALALKQNSPHIALEILSSLRTQNYVTIRNLKIWAYADLDRPEDAFAIVRNILEADDPDRKRTIGKQSLDKLMEAVDRSGRNDIKMTYEQLTQQLAAGGHINEQDQDEMLCSEIIVLPREDNRSRDGRFMSASFNYEAGRGAQRFVQRPGLADMN